MTKDKAKQTELSEEDLDRVIGAADDTCPVPQPEPKEPVPYPELPGGSSGGGTGPVIKIGGKGKL